MTGASIASRRTFRVAMRMSVTTTLSPSAISVVSDGRDLVVPVDLEVHRLQHVGDGQRGDLALLQVAGAPSLMCSTLGVTTARERPLRPIEEPRLVDRSAPSKRRPISPRALATSVELTQ